jgi:hypothetical protein
MKPIVASSPNARRLSKNKFFHQSQQKQVETGEVNMHEKDEQTQGETFNQDQQEMFQHPDTALGETRPRIPGEENVPPAPPPATDSEESSAGDANRSLDNPNLI